MWFPVSTKPRGEKYINHKRSQLSAAFHPVEFENQSFSLSCVVRHITVGSYRTTLGLGLSYGNLNELQSSKRVFHAIFTPESLLDNSKQDTAP